jgi:hypothetical protein
MFPTLLTATSCYIIAFIAAPPEFFGPRKSVPAVAAIQMDQFGIIFWGKIWALFS